MKVTAEETTTTFIENGQAKSHDCHVGDWWGTDICDYVDLNKALKSIPDGEYKITIKIESVS